MDAYNGVVISFSYTQIEEFYRQISDMSGTTSQNLNVSRLVLQFSLRNLLKPDVKSGMKR